MKKGTGKLRFAGYSLALCIAFALGGMLGFRQSARVGSAFDNLPIEIQSVAIETYGTNSIRRETLRVKDPSQLQEAIATTRASIAQTVRMAEGHKARFGLLKKEAECIFGDFSEFKEEKAKFQSIASRIDERYDAVMDIGREANSLPVESRMDLSRLAVVSCALVDMVRSIEESEDRAAAEHIVPGGHQRRLNELLKDFERD